MFQFTQDKNLKSHQAYRHHSSAPEHELHVHETEDRQTVKSALEERPQITYRGFISDVQPLLLNFKDRKHLFIFSPTALSFLPEDLGIMAIPAATWTNITFEPGFRCFTQGTPNGIQVYLKATDEIIP